MAYFHLGEYQLSLDDFHAALRCSPQDDNQEDDDLQEETQNEKQKRIQSFIAKAEKGLSQQTKAILKRKSALQKAFHSNSVLESIPTKNPPAAAAKVTNQRFQWSRRDILFLASMVFILAIAIFVGSLTLE